jgi:prephenate dehydrogenase
MSVQITFIGLNSTNASIGLALAPHKNGIVRLGIDRSPETAQQAEKKGWIDKAVFNLEKSVENSDLVILAVPQSELKETLELIGPALREGAVVLDSAPTPVTSLKLAHDLLPDKSYFLTFYPTLNPCYALDHEDAQPMADRFKNGQAVITCSNDTPQDAIHLAADLAKLLEAVPFYCDPFEFQGWYALSHSLAQLASIALLNTASAQPGWRDAQKITGSHFYSATRLMDGIDPSTWLSNRENLVRILDQYMHSLQDLRQLLQAGNGESLDQLLAEVQQTRLTWEKQRQIPGETIPERPLGPSASEHLASAFGISQLAGLFKQKKKS